jgi:hypothetical protein
MSKTMVAMNDWTKIESPPAEMQFPSRGRCDPSVGQASRLSLKFKKPRFQDEGSWLRIPIHQQTSFLRWRQARRLSYMPVLLKNLAVFAGFTSIPAR